MKKVFPTVLIVLLFTLVFLLCFRECVGAEEIIEDAIEGAVLETPQEEDEKISETPHPSTELTPSPRGEGETKDEGEEKFDLKAYVEERIVPVISGVGAAIIAILVALGPLISAIKAIKNAAASFSKKDEERNASQKESNKIMQKNIERIEKNVAEVSKLQAQVEMLERQAEEMKRVCVTLAKITALGFQSNADVVRSGRGKKMAILLNKIANITDEGDGSIVIDPYENGAADRKNVGAIHESTVEVEV